MTLCPSVCSSQVAAQPITVVCKAARVYIPILLAFFERFTVYSAKMAEPIDGKASNRLRYTLSVQPAVQPAVKCRRAFRGLTQCRQLMHIQAVASFIQ